MDNDLMQQLAVVILRASLSPHKPGLHHCDDCGCDFRHPTSWSRADESWALELRCPNCLTQTSGLYTAAEVSALEAKLDADEDMMEEDMIALEQEGIEAEIEVFSKALAVGALLPEDF